MGVGLFVSADAWFVFLHDQHSALGFTSPDCDSFHVFSVRRLSAAASGQDPAQHGDGEGRRRLDGAGRVPG